MRDEEKKFDGIILPLPFRDLGRGNNDCLGHIMGISLRELRYGPDDLNINYAIPKSEGWDFGLFWIDNCVKDPTSPYSTRACYTWLLPHFSNIGENERTSIRVKPTTDAHPRWYDYDFIFWHKGKPVPIGQQHVYGNDAFRSFNHAITLSDVIKKWEEERYDMKFQESLGSLKEKTDSIMGHLPMVKLRNAQHELEVECRDSGWQQKLALMSDVV